MAVTKVLIHPGRSPDRRGAPNQAVLARPDGVLTRWWGLIWSTDGWRVFKGLARFTKSSQ